MWNTGVGVRASPPAIERELRRLSTDRRIDLADEGRFDDLGRNGLAANFDGEDRTHTPAFVRDAARNVAEPYRLSEGGGGCARRHHTDRLCVPQDWRPLPSDAAFDQLEAHQGSDIAPGFPRFHSLCADVSAALSLHETREPSLERRRGVVEFVAIEGKCGFESQGVACAKSSGQETQGFPRF